ncbi:ATP synthase F1 subunit gamma [Phycisphaeraceae bacterium D3-23]
MPANIREIKGRIKAVGNIKRITHTMQLIASAKFQQMQKRATDAQAYTHKVAEVVGEVASTMSPGEVDLPLISPPAQKVGKELLLVLTSSRGLCGAYNGNVMRKALAHLNAQGQQNIDLEVVGKKGVGMFKFSRVPVDVVHDTISDTPGYDEVAAIAQTYMDAYIDGNYDAVRVCYMAFRSMSKQEPVLQTLLPLEPPDGGSGPVAERSSGQVKDSATGPQDHSTTSAVNYEFSPGPEELLGELLPITVKSTLFQCFNEAIVSEQIARMVAMKSATDAAGKMGKSLKRQFNRARQAAITTELSEIIAGAAALE